VVVVLQWKPFKPHADARADDPDAAGVLGEALGVRDERVRRDRLLVVHASVGHCVQLRDARGG
jgi:hypothetical protein